MENFDMIERQLDINWILLDIIEELENFDITERRLDMDIIEELENFDITERRLDMDCTFLDIVETPSQELQKKYSNPCFETLEVDPFSIPTLQSPLYLWENESSILPISDYGLMDSFTDFTPFLEDSSSNETPHVLLDDENRKRVWSGTELDCLFDSNKTIIGEEMKQEVVRDKNKGISKVTRESVSKCFYMPIAEAAKELNVGVTLLKRRCRELGIRRWPHRKLMSLETLTNNVKELMAEEEDKGKIEEEIRRLEKEKKLLEKMPDMELSLKTRKIRQACFKANYKKRKLMSDNNGDVHNHHSMVDDDSGSTSEAYGARVSIVNMRTMKSGYRPD